MTQHDPHVEAEVRETPPENGWRCFERTGRARVTCPCGLDTGMVPVGRAWGEGIAHIVAAWP